MGSHPICPSHCDGLYIPVDFLGAPPDANNKMAGGGLRGRQRAPGGLILAAPLLGIKLKAGKPTKVDVVTIREEDNAHPLWIERRVWLAMYEKFRLSIEHKTAVVFG